jgi:hypothetical protein
VTWLWLVALLIVPALVIGSVLVISHLDAFETDFSRTGNIVCPHCQRETPPRRKVCRHCGHELQ